MNGLDPCVFCCEPQNDLYRVLDDTGLSPRRTDAFHEAVSACPRGGGVLVLADTYPVPGTALTGEHLDLLRNRGIRCYLEYPASCDGVEMDEPRETGRMRLVAQSAGLGLALPRDSILNVHNGWFQPVLNPTIDQPILSLAKVAGYTTAVYGVPRDAHPVLFSVPGNEDLLVATTKLSHLVTGRYAPRPSWAALWQWILSWVSGGVDVGELHWQPSVRTRYGPQDTLPGDAEDTALRASVEWFRDHTLFSVDWKKGAIEGFESSIDYRGRQASRTICRGDCTGETALVFALDYQRTRNPASRLLAEQILDYVWSSPDFFQDDPKSPVFGLNNWNVGNPVFYGDDNARVIIPTLAASAALGTDRWSERVLRCILANYRTTGPLGFRRARLDLDHVVRDHRPWMFYYDTEVVHLAPHYQGYLWACLIWASAITSDGFLMERTRIAIRMTMDAYPTWKWTNGLTQEMARMLLPLAFLVRVEDTPEHRGWLQRVAGDLLDQLAPSGSIHELMGAMESGSYPSPRSNEDYGTTEASIIQNNGDPACDLLYTVGYALLGLHEAAAATGSEELRTAEDRLSAFLCRIQVVSQDHPYLHGAWMRSFDDELWEYWGSSADQGWGAWSVETGWYNSWIASVLTMRSLGTTLFTTAGLEHMARDYPALKKEMLEERPFDPAAHGHISGVDMPGAE